MDAITPLVMLWMATQGTAQAKAKAKAKPPKWPTPTSPPPMPAFKPTATPTPADASHPATPLAELHAKPPTPPPANKPATARKPAARTARVPRITPGVLTSTLPVSRLQQALNKRGANLVPDGLFGPKTAAAWANAAASKALPSTITRAGPKLANVSTTAFDVLSMLPIP